MKVKLKKEIVTMGQPNIDPTINVGNYIEPNDWNSLISEEDVVVIDTRNDYEVAIGSFDGAVDPETKSFGEFPEWWQKINQNIIINAWQCFVPVELDVKNLQIFYSMKGLRMFII